MTGKPEFEVLGWRKNPVMTPLGLSTVEVIGKITRDRLLCSYEADHVRIAMAEVRRSNISQIGPALDRLEEKIEVLAQRLNDILNKCGDIDPRHQR
jgi:hypothetical protein